MRPTKIISLILALILAVSALIVPTLAASNKASGKNQTSNAKLASCEPQKSSSGTSDSCKPNTIWINEEEDSALLIQKLPEEITYKKIGNGGSSGAASVTATVAWDLKNGQVSVYEQPYNSEAAPWLLAFLYTESENHSSALEARLGYDGMKQNQDLILAENPYITSGKIKFLVVVDNKGYQQTADQYLYSFQVVNRQLRRVDCSKVEADLYGTNVRRVNSWVEYDYDTAGRVVAIRHSDGRNDTFTYASDGRLISFTIDKLTLKPQYSDTMQMIPVNQTTKTTYGQDLSGNIISVKTELPGVYSETYTITKYAE